MSADVGITGPADKPTITGPIRLSNAKLAKLGQGHLDLHSSRSVLDQESLARMAAEHGAPAPLGDGIIGANTANQMLALAADAEFPLADLIAAGSRRVAQGVTGPDIALEVLVVDRQGRVVGRAPGW